MHQAVDGTFGWSFNVDQPIVSTNFKVFSRVFIDKRAAEYTETADTCRERYWASDLRTGAFNRIDDFGCRRV